MKLVLTNDAESAPGVIVVDHFTMTHIVHFLRGEGIEIPKSHLTPHAQETAAPCEHMACEPVMLCMDCGKYFD